MKKASKNHGLQKSYIGGIIRNYKGMVFNGMPKGHIRVILLLLNIKRNIVAFQTLSHCKNLEVLVGIEGEVKLKFHTL